MGLQEQEDGEQLFLVRVEVGATGVVGDRGVGEVVGVVHGVVRAGEELLTGLVLALETLVGSMLLTRAKEVVPPAEAGACNSRSWTRLTSEGRIEPGLCWG